VLSTVVNFFNPHAVLLTGSLATIEPFVAAVRGALYERCLPMATQNLEVAVASAGAAAGALGAGQLALQAVHSKGKD
jgi:predicted NBD/HSP70 family sugar kinase